MRIVIDLQGAQGESRLRGIGRYSLAIALAIARNKGKHEVLIVLNGLLSDSVEPIRAAFNEILPSENIRVWFAQGPLHAMDPENTWRRNTAELIRESFLASLEPDIVLVTSLFEGFVDNAVHSIGLGPYQVPTAVISYDLIPLMQSETYLKPNSLYEAFYRRSVDFLKKADLYLAISNSSGRELSDYLGIKSSQISNILASVDDCFRPIVIPSKESAKIRRKFGLTKPFVMYSGGADIRKNHLRLIKAFALLPEEIRNKYQLVIVGKLHEEEFQRFTTYAEIHDLTSTDVVLTGKVSDDELVKLYNLAELFVLPSWHEGFGLPALEAMSCGTATIGANTTSVPEVIGRKDALFDPFNAFAISQKIAEVLTNQNFRKQLEKHGLKQAKLFSWDNSAKTAISSFENFHFNRKDKIIKRKQNISYTSWLTEKIARVTLKMSNETDLVMTANAIAQNHPHLQKRQLLVDISELVKRDSKTGIQRVVRSIIAELFINPPNGFNVELVYADPNGTYQYARKFTQNFLSRPKKHCIDEPVTVLPQDIFLGLDLAHNVVLSNQSFYEKLRLMGAKVYFVVYDLLPILNPEVFPAGVQNIHSQWMEVLALSDGLVCISRAVADEVVEWLDGFGPKRTRPLQIGWFHLGADLANSLPTKGMPENGKEILNVLSKFPTFLMVGTVEPRKRQLQALLAFERLWAQGYKVNLVIVGKHGWNVDLLVEMLSEHPEKDRHLFWLSQTSDEFLDKIYSASSCLIAASAGEGFGLPLIEAAQHNIPIIARDIPVFKEIAGEHAFYFEGNSVISLANCIIDWLGLENPPTSDMPWITWKQSKEQLLNVILGGRWYREWIQDDILRFWGSHPRLHSVVGKRLARSIASTGKRGYLIYGPYIQLDEGTYNITIHGHWSEKVSDEVHVDSTMNNGQSIIFNKKLKEILVTESKAVLTVSLQQSCSDFEFRIWVDDEIEIEIAMIEIKLVDEEIQFSNFRNSTLVS